MAALEKVYDRALVPASESNFRTPPHNIEAEQALLGAILVNNDAFDRVSDFLSRSISPRTCTGASTRSPAS